VRRQNQIPDEEIVELYWQRSESALSETAAKYGDYCSYIAYNILYNREDTEECERYLPGCMEQYAAASSVDSFYFLG